MGRFEPIPARVAIIFEHQSSVDPTMAFRMLRYTVRTWERWLREPTNRRKGRLPLVLPVVLYHGARPWSAAKDLAALVGPASAPPALAETLAKIRPHATYQLLDLRETEESALQGSWPGLLCLWLFKAHTSGDLISALARFFVVHGAAGDPENGDPETMAAFIDYMWSTDSRLKGLPSHAKVPNILQESIGDHPKGIAELLRDEGRQEGRHSALAQTLMGLLERRFGELDDDQRSQIMSEGDEAIQRVIDTIFDLSSIDEAIANL